MRATIIAAVAVLAFSTNSAFAVSLAVKLACKDDYFAHCSMHSPGSVGVRQCMRKVGAGLSARCIGALADAGEIKQSVKKKYFAKQQNAQMKVALKSAPKKQYAQKSVTKKKYAAKVQNRRTAERQRNAERQRIAKKQYERKYYTRLAADH